jgi:hypothetical protein
MNLNTRFTGTLRLAAGVLIPALLITGCGSNGSPDPAVAEQKREMEQLRQENQELAQVRTENEEVQRLKKENQDLPRLRSQYQEASRLAKENDQLRQQIAKISPAALSNAVQVAPGQVPVTGQLTQQSAQEQEKSKEAAEREAVLNQGDEIMVDPKALKAVLPEIDWEKMNRKDPLAVRALLERDGIQITNVQQIKELGITNFVIQRGVPKPQTQPAPQNQ